MAGQIHVPTEFVSSAIERLVGERPTEVSLTCRPLRGGLTARAVLLLRGRFTDRRGRKRAAQFVLKLLQGSALRERRIYEEFVASHARGMSPALLGVLELSPGCTALLLEAIPSVSWPWRDTRAGELFMRRLGAFHLSTKDTIESATLGDFGYEEALEISARQTYETLLCCKARPEISAFVRAAPATQRLVLAIRPIRDALLNFERVRRCVLHGDVHPGNVLVRRARGDHLSPVLIDWERARIGSPLEDVSSWLQSLGLWEPEARRRHDTLFARYLSAIGLERHLTQEIRAAYWMASASNALAGALRYHLAVALNDRVAENERAVAARAAHAWLRVLRRADAFWS